MYSKGILCQTTSVLYQGTDRIISSSPIIHTRMEYGTFDLHGICISFKDRVNSNGVTIHQFETTQVKFWNIISRILFTRNTIYLNAFLICFGRETTRILKQCCQALTFTHFIGHRAFHLACDVNKAIICANHNHIIISQADITCQFTIKDIIIHVDNRQLPTTPINLDAAERTNASNTTSHINSMEHSCKSRKRICTRSRHLTHHVD